MASVLAFNYYDLSSNPADAYIFSVKLVFEKTKNKQKTPKLAHLKQSFVKF